MCACQILYVKPDTRKTHKENAFTSGRFMHTENVETMQTHLECIGSMTQDCLKQNLLKQFTCNIRAVIKMILHMVVSTTTGHSQPKKGILVDSNV